MSTSMVNLKCRVFDGTPWRLVLTGNEEVLRKGAEYPGSHKGREGVTYELSAAVLEWFRAECPDVEFSAEVVEWETRYLALRSAVQSVVDLRRTRTTIELPYADKLFDYQTVGVKWLTIVKRGILADEPGLGKTIQSLAAADLVGAKKVLIITINDAVMKQWVDTVEAWQLGTIVSAGTGTVAQRLKRLGGEARFYVIPSTVLSSNQGGARASASRGAYKAFLEQHWDVVIVDEAHQFQAKDSARTKALAKIKSEYLFLLTGTPLWNRGESLFSLLHLIDPYRWSSEWQWLDKYFQVNTTPWGRKVGKLRQETFAAMKNELHSVLLRRTLIEVHKDVPEARTQVLELDLPKELRTQYQILKSQVASYQPVMLGDKEVTITAPTQLLQIGRAFLNNPGLVSERLESHDVKTPSIVALCEQIVSAGGQVLVFTWHTDYADSLAIALTRAGIQAIPFHGKVASSVRSERLSEFKAGVYRVLVASIASLGTGVDLPNVNAAVFAETDWTPAVIEQSWRRIYRITSSSAKLIYFVYYKNTIEERIFNVFMKKQVVSEALLTQQVLKE